MPSQPLSEGQVWPRIITELPLEVMLGMGQQQQPPSVTPDLGEPCTDTTVNTRPPGNGAHCTPVTPDSPPLPEQCTDTPVTPASPERCSDTPGVKRRKSRQALLPTAGGCAATGLRSGPSSTLIKLPCGRGPLPLLHCVTWGIPQMLSESQFYPL